MSGSLDGKLRLWNIPDKRVALWNEIEGVGEPSNLYITPVMTGKSYSGVDGLVGHFTATFNGLLILVVTAICG